MNTTAGFPLGRSLGGRSGYAQLPLRLFLIPAPRFPPGD